MKDNRYLIVKIELCRNCIGRGMVAIGDGIELPNVDTVVEGVCPICQGSGKIKKRKEIRVVVEPYV